MGTFQNRFKDHLEVSQVSLLDHKEIIDKSNALTPFPTKGKGKIFFNFSKSPFGASVC